jgi:hypothetical protein
MSKNLSTLYLFSEYAILQIVYWFDVLSNLVLAAYHLFVNSVIFECTPCPKNIAILDAPGHILVHAYP